MNLNDTLLYCDAGCILNINGKERLLEYFNIVEKSELGILSFKMESQLEKYWCKNDLVLYLKAEKYLEDGQYIGGVVVLKKNKHVVDLINKYCELSQMYHLIDDSKSIVIENKGFIEHRHDQSIFSLLRKICGSEWMRDETFFYPNWEKSGLNYPIWAIRKK